jgi:hypothetical protein
MQVEASGGGHFNPWSERRWIAKDGQVHSERGERGCLDFGLKFLIVRALLENDFLSLGDSYSACVTNGTTARLQVDQKHVEFYGIDAFRGTNPYQCALHDGDQEGAERFVKIFDAITTALEIHEVS